MCGKTNDPQSINPENVICIEESKDPEQSCPITKITFNSNVRNLQDIQNLQQEGGNCEGFDESTWSPFPKCAEGLVCKETCEHVISGASCNTCVKVED